MINFVVIPWILAQLSAPVWVWIVWATGLSIKVAWSFVDKEV